MGLFKIKAKQHKELDIQQSFLDNRVPPHRVRKEPDPVPSE